LCTEQSGEVPNISDVSALHRVPQRDCINF
jgi:hypothetical protein